MLRTTHLSLLAVLSPAMVLANDTCGTASPAGSATDGAVSTMHGTLSVGETSDHFRIAVSAGHRANIQTLFSHAGGDLDLRLWNADCSVLLDSSTSMTDDEAAEWFNDTGAATEVVAEVFVSAPLLEANDYSLRVAGSFESCDFDDSFEPNESCATAAASPLAFQFPLTLTASDHDWIRFDVPATTSVQFNVNTSPSASDTAAELWSDDCGTLIDSTSFGLLSPLQFVNEGTTPTTVVLHVFRTDSLPSCSSYAVFVTSTVGVRECSSVPNSTGSPATLFGLGSQSLSVGTLVLHASLVPPGQFGLFAFGPDAASTPLGNGTLCIGANGIARGFVRQAGDFALESIIDLSNPGPGIPPITVGTTLRFQAWFRDPQDPTGFGLSDALRISFTN